MYDIFISHSSKDKLSIVHELTKRLIEQGLNVWFDEDVILSGDNILEEINKGISQSLCVAVILTPAFFESSWTTIELGIAIKSQISQIIPIIVDDTIDIVAKKLPFLLSQKYIVLCPDKINICASELAKNSKQIKQQYLEINPLDYHELVRKLNNFDSPSTNRTSILITEYEQICKISITTGITHASQIAIAIINDVFSRVQKNDDDENISPKNKLDLISQRNSGINQNIKEHLSSLINMPNDIVSSTFSNEVDRKKMTDLSLASILNWYLSYISILLKKNQSDDIIEVVWSGELNYQDFEDMYEIDQLVLRRDLIATPEITFNWYSYNNFTHIAVRSIKTGKIIGYFALLPVTEELYEDIKSGVFKDNNLSIENIRQYDIPDFYKLYVACVCVHPSYQNTMAFNKLYNALIRMMYDLATEREIYITDIITEASTPQGEKLCKILGLHKLKNTELDTDIYTASLLPPSLRLNSNFGHKLIKFYQEKYLEMKELF